MVNAILSATAAGGVSGLAAGLVVYYLLAPLFSNKIVFAGAIASAGVAGMLVGMFDVRGTAYVPSVMAPLLSNNMLGFVAAMV
ncbi:hypothetical protein MXD63_41935, partial [Frankia sp. Cpl3]|nr:hypothetical protein [Frankia sp. Cpl3]